MDSPGKVSQSSKQEHSFEDATTISEKIYRQGENHHQERSMSIKMILGINADKQKWLALLLWAHLDPRHTTVTVSFMEHDIQRSRYSGRLCLYNTPNLR